MIKDITTKYDNSSIKLLSNMANVDINCHNICIVNAQNSLSNTHRHLSELSQHILKGVISAGGCATIATITSIDSTCLANTTASNYDLPSRETISKQIELIDSTNMYDGYIYVAGENNTLAGMLLGAVIVNKPCLFVGAGIMSPIVVDNEQLGIFDIYSSIAKVSSGSISLAKLEEIVNSTPLTSGNDCNSYSHSSMICTIEAMGLALSGTATAPSMSYKQAELAKKSGQALVNLIDNKIMPRRVLTERAIINGIICDLACGGSSTTVINILALAKQLNRNITLDTIDNYSRSTPLLLDSKCPTMLNQLNSVGGIYSVLTQLALGKLIDTSCIIYDGTTLSNHLSKYKLQLPLHSCTSPVSAGSRLRVLKGNLAEDGCICIYNGNRNFEGAAKVYNSQNEAVSAILHGEITSGTVMVILNQGAISGSGMPEISMPLLMLNALELYKDVAVITDGRISDHYKGMAVGNIVPESDDGTAFATLLDGDKISISVTKGKLALTIKAKDLQTRIKCHHKQYSYTSPLLSDWSENALSASQGCYRKQ